MVLEQVDRHQGATRAEQYPPVQRTLESVAQRFQTFAREECSGTSPLAVLSRYYERLSIEIARTPAMLRLARWCRPGQPIPNLFFAAVKRVVASQPQSDLARLYADADHGRDVPPGLGEAFGRFCASHEAEILHLVKSRRVQTNEIRRCSYLMPAFGVVAQLARDRPLALIDVGASAGLNLLWDRYRYRYSDGSEYGPPESRVLIDCELRTPMPSLPPDFPEVASSVGIDLDPVDMSDDEESEWMMALVWPDHRDRAKLLREARRIWLDDPPRVDAGDAIDLLPSIIDQTPEGAALCVFHCHTLNQFPLEARDTFRDTLNQASERRDIYYVPSEGAQMSLYRVRRGERTVIMSARRHAHGRWIEWTRLP